MSKIETYACDVCSIQKQPSNNWWKIFLLDKDTDNSPAGVMIIDWNVNAITRPKEIGGGFISERADAHICGSKCLLEWTSKHLLERTQNQ